VEDGATVPIYYEGRLAKLELSEAERPKIDPDFEEVTEGEEVERKEGLKSKWAQLAAVVGSEKWLKLVDKSKSSPNTGRRRRRTRPMSDVEGR
jgi:type I restriction enzyme R subunit